ncbi:hypothetical protein NDU88_002830 [Pleurodeles waltl]|uniref:Uncharacterized protein n=1 Tax=Pleurodeles waltl TaxID=8319 RepID=A0AAV7NI63_PLEWA|nr:hypothetical protein NDU88_002830 [Pleurodeles waltl]
MWIKTGHLRPESRKMMRGILTGQRMGGDTFYSLMEESEAASSGYDLNKEDDSGSSEAESLSPAVGPRVRPQRQHRKRIMSKLVQLALQILPRGALRRSSGTTQELNCRNLREILRSPEARF